MYTVCHVNRSGRWIARHIGKKNTQGCFKLEAKETEEPESSRKADQHGTGYCTILE